MTGIDKAVFIYLAAFLFLMGGCSINPPMHPVTAINSGPLSPLQAGYDIQHYSLDIKVNPEDRSISGEVSMQAVALDALREIELDLDPRFKIHRTRVNGKASGFVLAEGKLVLSTETLPIGEEFTTTVVYAGRPHIAIKPPWDGGFVWQRTESGEHWIATAVQLQGCDLYWPCKDHVSDKADRGADMMITVPAGLVAVMNGLLLSETENGKTTTFHWRTINPISAQHLAINIGPFRKFEMAYRGSIAGNPAIPLVFYHVTDDMEKIEQLIAHDFVRQITFFERTLGPFPWGNEKIGIVEIPYLGMEHQTMNGYGNEFKLDPYGFDWLIHHEFAHEWFGNLMTQFSARDFWLHEATGEYMQPVYASEVIGDAGYWHYMWEKYHQIENCKPMVPDEQVAMDYFDSSEVYKKGSWVLHTLRWLMGEDAFWRTIRRLLYDTVDPWSLSYPISPVRRSIEDFIRIANEEHGSDLGWFFDVYLRSIELPRLREEVTGEGLRLSWVNYPGFRMAMPVRIIEGDNAQMVEVPVDGSVFPLPPGSRYQIDPETRVLRDFGTSEWCKEKRGH